MNKYLNIVKKIHNSPYKLTFVSSGGGTNAISSFLEVPGASNTILESYIPYSKESMDKFLNRQPDHYCSLETCLSMAANAYKKSKEINNVSKSKHLLGVAITANLKTTYEKKGEHKFFIVVQAYDYTKYLECFLEKENEIYGDSLEIFPKEDKIFNSMNICDFSNLKVVLLGQDPYHQKGQAMGLSFSVPENIKIPPSLVNIYKELKTDCNIEHTNGDLTNWAKQGVLLLNTSLTVRESCPNSHQKYWRPFTDNLIKYISDNKEGIVFLLWGGNAKDKKKLIDSEKHYILEANHPSPLSANRGGWFGCKHFSKTNDYLREKGEKTIMW